MRKHHPENERTKRRYVEYLKHARQLSDTSIDQTVAAIADFEGVTGWRDFRKFRIEWAQKYKRDLGERTNNQTGKPLAKATISSRLMALMTFSTGWPGSRAFAPGSPTRTPNISGRRPTTSASPERCGTSRSPASRKSARCLPPCRPALISKGATGP